MSLNNHIIDFWCIFIYISWIVKDPVWQALINILRFQGILDFLLLGFLSCGQRKANQNNAFMDSDTISPTAFKEILQKDSFQEH